jgi:hypothetical protein
MSARYQRLPQGVFDFQTRTVILFGNPGWQEYQDWLTAGGVLLPADPAGQMDLTAAVTAKNAEINSYAASLRNKVIAGRSSGELASWAIKIGEARAFATGGDAAAPTLAATAAIRGITTAALVAKVIAQATPFLQAEAAIDGVRGKHCDAIALLTDVQSVVAYDWSVGWPAI